MGSSQSQLVYHTSSLDSLAARLLLQQAPDWSNAVYKLYVPGVTDAALVASASETRRYNVLFLGVVPPQEVLAAVQGYALTVSVLSYYMPYIKDVVPCSKVAYCCSSDSSTVKMVWDKITVPMLQQQAKDKAKEAKEKEVKEWTAVKVLEVKEIKTEIKAEKKEDKPVKEEKKDAVAPPRILPLTMAEKLGLTSLFLPQWIKELNDYVTLQRINSDSVRLLTEAAAVGLDTLADYLALSPEELKTKATHQYLVGYYDTRILGPVRSCEVKEWEIPNDLNKLKDQSSIPVIYTEIKSALDVEPVAARLFRQHPTVKMAVLRFKHLTEVQFDLRAAPGSHINVHEIAAFYKSTVPSQPSFLRADLESKYL